MSEVIRGSEGTEQSERSVDREVTNLALSTRKVSWNKFYFSWALLSLNNSRSENIFEIGVENNVSCLLRDRRV